jgi:hypothetical protein
VAAPPFSSSTAPALMFIGLKWAVWPVLVTRILPLVMLVGPM